MHVATAEFKTFSAFRLLFGNSHKPLLQLLTQKSSLRCRGKNGLQTILQKRVGDRMKILEFLRFSYDLPLVSLQLRKGLTKANLPFFKDFAFSKLNVYPFLENSLQYPPQANRACFSRSTGKSREFCAFCTINK